MTKLDEFLNKEETKLQYQVKDKVIIGDISSLTMLKLTKYQDIKDESKQAEVMFNTIFGEENAKFLFDNLNVNGILKIADDITKSFGIVGDEQKK